MKLFFYLLKHRISTMNPSRLLGSILLGFVLVIYACTVYIIVLSLGTFPFGETPDRSLLPTANQWLLNLITVLCLSLTFVPISRWLQNRINEMIYARDDDLDALPVLINQQLRGMQNLNLTLPQVVEAIGTKLYVPFVAIVVENAPDQHCAFGVNKPELPIVTYPVSYLDQPLATLLVSHRAKNRPLTDSDDAILRECAQQMGIALYVVGLTAVLQTAREQLIIAREAERRRIRNDLHDGLAPTLSSFQLQLGTIRRLLSQNPAQAEQMIAELSSDLREATAVIRQLVYDLRPPLLDDLGLIEAIKNMRLTDTSLQLTVIAPDPLPTLSAAVEVALYRIASEALHNITKHAQATRCTINLLPEADSILLTIVDDGQGIGANQLGGIGIQSMRDRATELGGTFTIQPISASGTQLEVRLPL